MTHGRTSLATIAAMVKKMAAEKMKKGKDKAVKTTTLQTPPATPTHVMRSGLAGSPRGGSAYKHILVMVAASLKRALWRCTLCCSAFKTKEELEYHYSTCRIYYVLTKMKFSKSKPPGDKDDQPPPPPPSARATGEEQTPIVE